MQTRLNENYERKIITVGKTYGKPQYNKIKNNRQRIELSRGCPHGCPYCFEAKYHLAPKIKDVVVFPIPKIKKNYIEILDMNFLWQPNILERIKELGNIKVNDKIVYYEEICGFDFRLITEEIAVALKKARFKKIRLAWDWFLKHQYKLKDTINCLLKAGYKTRDISCFMIINYKIPYEECLLKLDILKVWNIKVCDCCYDGGYKYAISEFWAEFQIKDFRKKCRKHNQLINFGIDPEIKQ